MTDPGSLSDTGADVVILLGPPGAGKGTQARMLDRDFGLVQLSTGDILRAAVAAGTATGRAAGPLMTAGKLVPDDLVMAALAERLKAPDAARGVVLDGVPRTEAQAAALDTMLVAAGRRVTAAISLEVDDAAMVARVAGRFTCATCGEGYHDRFKPPATAGVCDTCGAAAFTRRADDTAEAVRERLAAYHAQTAPLLAHYDARGVLHRIDAMGPIATIRAAVAAVLDRMTA